MQHGSPLTRTGYDPYIIPLKGVLTMAKGSMWLQGAGHDLSRTVVTARGVLGKFSAREASSRASVAGSQLSLKDYK